ncbi:MAG: hypothetical protein HONBIEJF_01579 [Fimbriimonadaceae bacterium]|nr:hypothetical protein [Fimbriimonadaceae bacterium]
MQERKQIAVIGSTGAQGGGLARALAADSNFSVRGLTRNPSGDAARSLAQAGTEVVAADLEDVDSLKRAFEGAHGVFGVTNFWEHFSPETELRQALNIAEAARASGAAHVVWSTLEDTRKWVPLEDDRMPTLMERYKVPHFDAKGEADAYFAGLPTTYLLTSFYWDNFIHFGMGPQPGPDGVLGITFPMGDAKLPGIAAADIGKCAAGIFRDGDSWIGKRVGIAGEHLTGAEMAATMSQVLGKEIRYNSVSPEAYRGFGFPGAEDLGNMFQFKRDFNDHFVGARSIEGSRRLNPDLQSFRQWLESNQAAFA